jgi:hypothetical protein
MKEADLKYMFKMASRPPHNHCGNSDALSLTPTCSANKTTEYTTDDPEQTDEGNIQTEYSFD